MSHEILKHHLTQSLNMGLALDAENSYNHSFDIKISDNGMLFIPFIPAGFVLTEELYQKIYTITSVASYPYKTVLKQNAARIVQTGIDDIHRSRAFEFPWIDGVPKRLIINDLRLYSHQLAGSSRIPLMADGIANINIDKMTTIIISGNSGSGKSYCLTYLLEMLKLRSDLVVVDPKFDAPSRWCRENNVGVIAPHSNRSKSDFITQINNSLSLAVDLIHKRQQQLYDNPQQSFKRYTIIIDEVMALTEGIPKQLKEIFFSLISQIALLGRATKVGLILVSQRFDHQTIPTSVRDQATVLIQVGIVNSRTTQFLFPDFDVTGLVIPTGQGTGLVQIIDSDSPHQILPLLTPTYSFNGGNVL
ncbi:ATP-binding protein [Streptococcus cuniculi]|uniref:Cell division protein FtsK n=1 Tax=Streptococcus cuniculi TaxID=1432788 RepID=A0A4Y9J8W8_9STRE|nr:AAA family ATPase [Streptococcus cuniculi]MBF0778655.1 AAA family ATPase [Streptococcus cuniculi]TFU97470.1 cell division protein FtsK [Streptococcus cuniculi]